MLGSVFDSSKEETREDLADDGVFYKNLGYFFELQVPKTSVPSTSDNAFYYPLPMGPESYEIIEPFALSQTFTQGSGMVVEENGIIGATIRLSGHCGWKPRPYQGSDFSKIKAPEAGKGWSRTLRTPPSGIGGITGFKHLQFLQDSVFRTYSDLKKDPASSEDTHLIWHDPKQAEHWEVAPQRFSLPRTLGTRNLPRYSIELLILGKATAFSAGFDAGEKSLLDKIRDVVKVIQNVISDVRSAIRDITNLVNQISRVVKGVIGLVKAVGQIISDAADFVNGVADLISAPFNAVAGVADQLHVALVQMYQAGASFPDTIKNSWKRMETSFRTLLLFPETFQTTARRSLLNAQKKVGLTGRSEAALLEASQKAPPNSFQRLLAMGTAPMPGDLDRAHAELRSNPELQIYHTTFPYRIHHGDTVQSLATRFLGSATLWRHLVVLNGLQAPYFSNEGRPGTVRPGSQILIPSKDNPPAGRLPIPVLGALASAPIADRMLGSDFKLAPTDDPGDLWDFEIDPDSGGTDLRIVHGIQNMEQGLLTRLRTERGTNPIFPNLGLQKVVGQAGTATLQQLTVIRIQQALTADWRVSAIRDLRLKQPTPDTIELDVDVEVSGLGDQVPIQLRI